MACARRRCAGRPVRRGQVSQHCAGGRVRPQFPNVPRNAEAEELVPGLEEGAGPGLEGPELCQPGTRCAYLSPGDLEIDSKAGLWPLPVVPGGATG